MKEKSSLADFVFSKIKCLFYQFSDNEHNTGFDIFSNYSCF